MRDEIQRVRPAGAAEAHTLAPVAGLPGARRRVLVLGYYGAKNLGDDLMLHGILHWLRADPVQVTVVSEDPADTVSRFGVDAIQNVPLLGQWSARTLLFSAEWRALVRAVRSADALVVGGGDLVRDDLGWNTFSYTVEKLLLALSARVPVSLINVGIGEPHTVYGRAVLPRLLRGCRAAIVRDRRSIALCDASPPREGFRTSRDIVWFLPEILGLRPAPATGPIVVSLRGGAGLYGRFSLGDASIAGLAALLDALVRRTQRRVRFVPFQDLAGSSDAALHRAVHDRMEARDQAEHLAWDGDAERCFQRVADASLVVAMRLHAAIVARAMGRHVLALPYDYKMQELVAAEPGLCEANESQILDPRARATLVDQLVARMRTEPPASTAEPWACSAFAALGAVGMRRV